LRTHPTLWRRVAIREELLGLAHDEMAEFLAHHFGAATAKRFGDDGLRALFEAGKGSPGLILPPLKRILASSSGKASIDVAQITELLARIAAD
jgi:type II secretory pathway predicted ATPase ExeA